eukprot:scaffold21275_cov139-Skeletonema_dohrnii-CCMP3373.AAC.9
MSGWCRLQPRNGRLGGLRYNKVCAHNGWLSSREVHPKVRRGLRGGKNHAQTTPHAHDVAINKEFCN